MSRGFRAGIAAWGTKAYLVAAPSIFSPPRWMSLPAPATVLHPAERAAIESNMTRKTLFFMDISCLGLESEASIPQRPSFGHRPDTGSAAAAGRIGARSNTIRKACVRLSRNCRQSIRIRK